MGTRVRLVDEPGMERDLHSKALVSTNFKALAASRARLRDAQDLTHLKRDLNRVQDDIHEIKLLLSKMLKGKE